MTEKNTYVTYTRSELDALPDETDWERVDALTDEDIEKAALSDPDDPPTDADFWKDATVVMPEKRRAKMNESSTLIANAINNFDEFGKPIQVLPSNTLVHLVSEELYQSPAKAIEELVVNAYDADASECRLYVPLPSDSDENFAVVFDNGVGMDYDGLANLWQIGRSNKRTAEIESRSKRKQIGKFGVGKLAVNAIANRLTYITRNNDSEILFVTTDFRIFSDSTTEKYSPINLPVLHIKNLDELFNYSYMSIVLQKIGISLEELSETESWTITILEDLKDKARSITKGRLEWVLSTAMPLGDLFRLYLNGTRVKSSKEDIKEIINFDVTDLPEERLRTLREKTGENWFVQGDNLKSDSFESGISGTVKVTEKSLYTQGSKSDDLIRSHGFFIYARERLIDENDPLFGMSPMTYRIVNRLRAEVKADDLDQGLKVSRETVEQSVKKKTFQDLLRAICNEANSRYERWEKDNKSLPDQPEAGEKEIVAPREIAYPIADFLINRKIDSQGTEADDNFFYVEDIDPYTSEIDELIQVLFTTNVRQKFRYEYDNYGPIGRLVKYDPKNSTFWVNLDHEIVLAYYDHKESRRLLQDFVTAEALFEIYLRREKLPLDVVGNVLEIRDSLLRKLIKEGEHSNRAIARFLRDAATNANDLEIRLVQGVRTIGFVANRISGKGNPDGLAKFHEPGGKKIITLEAKSTESGKAPSIARIDFATLRNHVTQSHADGCLLVAPAYPGQTQEDSSAAKLAQENKISCWTVEQLATFVEDIERRQFTAKDLLDIVQNCYKPVDVATKLKDIASRTLENRSLYSAVWHALKSLQEYRDNRVRTVSMITTAVTLNSEFDQSIEEEDVINAIKEMSVLTYGGIVLNENEEVSLQISLDALKNRLNIPAE